MGPPVRTSPPGARLHGSKGPFGPVCTPRRHHGDYHIQQPACSRSSIPSEFCQYDAVNRLLVTEENGTCNHDPTTSCTGTGSGAWYENFSYDQYGNRAESSYNLGESGSPPTFDTNNRLAPNSSCQQPDAGTGWRYDWAGNVVRDSLNGTYAFDAEGRPVAAA